MSDWFRRLKIRIYQKLIDSNPELAEGYWRYKHSVNKRTAICGKLFFLLKFCLASVFKRNKESYPLPYPEYKVNNLNIDNLINITEPYDAVSFDLFGTLIFTLVDRKEDIYRLMPRYGQVNFPRLRAEAEQKLRLKKGVTPTLAEIYEAIEIVSGINLIDAEKEVLRKVTATNPFIYKVYEAALRRGQKIIVCCDSVYPVNLLKEILDAAGYSKIDEIIITSEAGATKSDGGFYRLVAQRYGRVYHIGGHYGDDYIAASEAGVSALYYPFSEIGGHFRLGEMKSLTSSFYKAAVNNRLHNGFTEGINGLYELGYAYCGYTVYGFCKWLSEFAKEKDIDLFLFSSRDTYIFQRIFEKYFGGTDSVYAYCSRSAVLRAGFPDNIDIFFDSFFRAKTDKVTIGECFGQAGLTSIAAESGIDLSKTLSSSDLETLGNFIICSKQKITDIYKNEKEAAEGYFASLTRGRKSVCIVDLGWRGITAVYLRKVLANSGINVLGAMIGAIDDPIPDSLMRDKLLYTYAFDNSKNKDLQPDRNIVLLCETMFSSNTPCLMSYGTVKDGETVFDFDSEFSYGNTHIDDIYRGIYDFCEYFDKITSEWDLDITGREAFLPLRKLLAENKDYVVGLLDSARNTDLCGCADIPLSRLINRRTDTDI